MTMQCLGVGNSSWPLKQQQYINWKIILKKALAFDTKHSNSTIKSNHYNNPNQLNQHNKSNRWTQSNHSNQSNQSNTPEINNGEGVENLLEAAGGPIDCRPKGLKSAKCLGISILQVVVQKHLRVLKFTLPLVPCDKGIVMVYRYTYYLCIPGIQSPFPKGNGT